jgi:hypothetical protein
MTSYKALNARPINQDTNPEFITMCIKKYMKNAATDY